MMYKLALPVFLVFALAMVVGCDTDKECLSASYRDNPHVPEDSLCLGTWQWVYTLEHKSHPWWDTVQGTYVSDTIFPGEYKSGFEVVEFAYGTITDSEICFNINGEIISGCYKTRSSVEYPSGTPLYVSGSFREWDASGWGSLSVDAYYTTENNDSVMARIGGLIMFLEKQTTASPIYYKHWFAKVD
jgi:hypothetical protein